LLPKTPKPHKYSNINMGAAVVCGKNKKHSIQNNKIN